MIEVTEEMIDRAMPKPDGDMTYLGCPLCGYTGHWNVYGETEERQRSWIRKFLNKALNNS